MHKHRAAAAQSTATALLTQADTRPITQGGAASAPATAGQGRADPSQGRERRPDRTHASDRSDARRALSITAAPALPQPTELLPPGKGRSIRAGRRIGSVPC